MRQRLTLLLTCSIRSRRWWSAWLARCCSRVSSAPRGFFVGMRISTSGSVNDRKPRPCNNPVRNSTKLSLLSGQRCWRDHPGLVQTRQKGQQRGADLICPVAQDIGPRMGKIVVEGGEGGFWEV